jgi:hypothetical protein
VGISGIARGFSLVGTAASFAIGHFSFDGLFVFHWTRLADGFRKLSVFDQFFFATAARLMIPDHQKKYYCYETRERARRYFLPKKIQGRHEFLSDRVFESVL